MDERNLLITLNRINKELKYIDDEIACIVDELKELAILRYESDRDIQYAKRNKHDRLLAIKQHLNIYKNELKEEYRNIERMLFDRI